MSTTVIICSVNRPEILHETVFGLMNQTVRPDAILLSLCDEVSVLPQTEALPGVRCILGPQGSSVQRNTAIPLARTPYVLFLDDNVELASDYIEQMERVFAQDPSVVAASGGIVADGTTGGQGIGRAVARKAIREYHGSRECLVMNDLYGCNMFVRSSVLRSERFDERLAMYGWLEDLDFRRRCEKHGKIVCNQGALGAHLGTPSGRTSDVRYGYSKIANPWYLWRKSVLTSLPELVLKYWLKTTLGNIARMLFAKASQRMRYRKRLLGNLLAYRDLISRRIDPRNVIHIPDTPSSLAASPGRETAAIGRAVASERADPGRGKSNVPARQGNDD